MVAMKFSQAAAILPELGPNNAILIRGLHGIGKSALGKHLARTLKERTGLDYEVIDRRLAQMQAGDMMGLPVVDDESQSTRFFPPDFIRVAGEKPIVLVLDEINRADREVQNVALQLALDRELSNGAKLHPETIVISMINTGSSMYQVTKMDPALLDRFFVIDLNFDADEWLTYAQEVGLHPLFLDFIRGEKRLLDVLPDVHPDEKGASPRSAEKLARVVGPILERAHETEKETGELSYDLPLIRKISEGFMGPEFAASFQEYLNNIVTNSKAITGEGVYENWMDIRKTIDLTRPDLMVRVVDRFLGHAGQQESFEGVNVPDHVKANFRQLLQDVPKEQITLIYQRILGFGVEKYDYVCDLASAGMDLLLEIYGTVPGEAGIGMLPTNPGAVINDDEENAA